MSAGDPLARAEDLLARLEAARAELDALGEDDTDRAVELLGRLAELAKEVEAELGQAKREADADARS